MLIDSGQKENLFGGTMEPSRAGHFDADQTAPATEHL